MAPHGSSLQPLKSPPPLSFLQFMGTSLQLTAAPPLTPLLSFPGSSRQRTAAPLIPIFLPNVCISWQLAAATLLPLFVPYSWHFMAAIGSPSPLPIAVISWQLAASNGISSYPNIFAIFVALDNNSRQPLPSPYFCHVLTHQISSRQPLPIYPLLLLGS